MNKQMIYLGILILGTVVTTGIDHLIGISYKDVGMIAQVAHKAAYVLWGGALMGLGKWRVLH